METKTKVDVNTLLSLNENELNILMTSLNSLEYNNEIKLTKQYGSVSSLFNKLYSKYEYLKQVS
jgi:hypothetical protein